MKKSTHQAEIDFGFLETDEKLVKDFIKFDTDNPDIWQLFIRFAMELIKAGRKRYSVEGIMHRIRWHVSIEIKGGKEYKINNNFSAFYGRKFTRQFPEHEGFFRFRKSIADRYFRK